MLDNLFKYAILLRLCHDFKQLIESVSWEYLPSILAEEKKLSEDQKDSILLILKGEK